MFYHPRFRWSNTLITHKIHSLIHLHYKLYYGNEDSARLNTILNCMFIPGNVECISMRTLTLSFVRTLTSTKTHTQTHTHTHTHSHRVIHTLTFKQLPIPITPFFFLSFYFQKFLLWELLNDEAHERKTILSIGSRSLQVVNIYTT